MKMKDMDGAKVLCALKIKSTAKGREESNCNLASKENENGLGQ